MNYLMRIFLRIKSVFKNVSLILKYFWSRDYFFIEWSEKGFVASYILVSIAVSTGLLGGFFLGRTNIIEKSHISQSKSELVRNITTHNSEDSNSRSLLGSVSEVFSRALGKNPENIIVEVNLEPRTSSSFDFELEKITTTTKLFSIPTSSKNKTVEKVVEKISACSSSSTTALSRDILINELAWMGSVAQSGENSSDASRKEWIELLNISSRTISLANWQIQDQAGKFKIIFPSGASLQPNNFYLLARGVAEKILGKKPDLLYGATLSNDGAFLRLINNRCEVVDYIDASAKWPAGNRETKQTLEKDADGLGWHTSVSPGGTPRAENSVIKTTTISAPSSGGGSSTESSSPSNSSSAIPIVYPKILISEVQTASASSTHDEFVELYNPSNEAVDLTNWYIQKKTKLANSFLTFLPKTVLAGKNIAAHGFFLISHPSSSLAVQVVTDEGLADHNTLVLKNPNGDIVDKVGWGEAGDFEAQAAPSPESGESIQRKISGSSLIDTENNSDDFEIKDCPSPQSFLGTCSELALLLSSSSESGTVTDTSTLILVSSSSEIRSSSTTATSSSDVSTASSTIEENVVTPTSTEIAAASSTVSSSTDSTSSTPAILFAPPDHLVIMEVQITGGIGKTDNDYIRIFNPTGVVVDVSGWKLRKRTQSGTESSIKVFPDGLVITSNGSFIWANSKDGFSELVGAHVSSTQTLASNNSTALLNNSDAVIDAVAWGSDHVNPFIEGAAFSNSTSTFHRKVSEGVIVDTDQNHADFEAISQ